MKSKYLISLSAIFLFCFLLAKVEGKKLRLASKVNKNKQSQNRDTDNDTTTIATELTKQNGTETKNELKEVVRSNFKAPEEDESGGGSIPVDAKELEDEGVNMPIKKTIYEEEFEIQKTFWEVNFTRVANRKEKPPLNSNKLPCDKTYIEFHIFSLIASKRLPEEVIYSTWNEKKSMKEKINFLNQTFINLDIPALPNCDPETLNLNLDPARLNFFKSIQITTSANKQNNIGEAESPLQGSTVAPAPFSAEEIKKLKGLIQAGYLPLSTIQELRKGTIDAEWIKLNISRNRGFVMSQLPEQIQNLISSAKMPKDVEEAIFSGLYNQTELQKLIFQNDEVIKLLLPQNVVDMLQDRPVPAQLKAILISGKNASEMKQAITNDTELMKQLMSPSMYFFYTLFEVQRNRDINVAISVVLMVVLTCVMMSLGCTMTLGQIGQHAKRPKGVIIALFAQFIMMPAAAFGLTKAFDLEVFAAMAVLICGCCPGGNLSNMLAYALSGDMNLSILMTTCSSIVGLGLMPLNIFIYSRFIVSLDSGQVVPFDKIVLNIAFTIIPVGIGIMIRHYKPQWVPIVMRVGAVVLGLGTVLIAVLSGVMFGDAFFIYFPTKVLACCAILPLSGYVFGYFFAWIARENPKCRRTICVETGCQNVQLCSTVLKLAFDPVLVGVLFLMPLVYMLFQVVEAFLMIFFFRLRNRCSGKKELEEEDSEVKKKSDVESRSHNGYQICRKVSSQYVPTVYTYTGTDKKISEENEMKNLLSTTQETSKETDSNGTAKPSGKEVDQTWPLEGQPTEAFKDSFQTAGSEHLL